MQLGYRIGSICGIPLRVHPSWLITTGMLTLVHGLEWQADYPEWGASTTWTTAFLEAMLLSVLLLLPELGRSLVARTQGIRTDAILLCLCGGIAYIYFKPKSPRWALLMTIAGPAITALLALLIFGFSLLLPERSPMAVLTTNLAIMNLILGLRMVVG